MTITLELMAVLFVVVLPGVLGCILIIKSKPDELSKDIYAGLSAALLYGVGTIFLMLYIAMGQEQKLLSIGIDLERHPGIFPEIIFGVFIGSIFLLISFLISRKILKKREFERSPKQVQTILACKTPHQRALLIARVLLAAIDEELVYRGYFVLLWGRRTDSIIACAIVSGLIFVAVHLYAGKKLIVYYVFVTLLLTASAILSRGIMIPIGIHIYLNLSSTIGTWSASEKEELTEQEASKEETDSDKPATFSFL